MSKHWPLPDRFCVRLTMESDWHVGSGMGRPGNVDRLIVRDADGLPFVPAKTLHGIWRDACERLCHGLDDGQSGSWSRLVDYLFGSQPALGTADPTRRHVDPAQTPLPSAVQIRAARLPSPLREHLARGNRRLRQATTFVKPGVKIDRRSGSAQTDFLRFEEVARKGTVLEAQCRLEVPPEAQELASAMLLASAALVERLGGKRRRGTGRCRLEILDADREAAVAWLEQATTAPEWATADRTAAVHAPAGAVEEKAQAAEDSWVCVPLRLHLLAPLAVSSRTTGNVVETLDFLPGTYLLPHVTRALRDLGLDARAAIQAGNLCVLPATPEIDGQRSQPTPFAWFAPKGMENPFERENRQQVVNRLLDDEPEGGAQLKQMRGGYVSARPAAVYQTPKTVRTHNTIADQPQRPTSDVGGVYTYEAIAPEVRGIPVILRSELRMRKSLADRLSPGWQAKLEGEVALGRSRKDDYGAVRVEAETPAPWTAQPPPRKDPPDEFVVWLVSDTLLRNERLGAEPTAACLGKELSRRLGVTLTLRESHKSLLGALVRIRRLDTWHVRWGLPRPTLIALQAGSCAVFTVASGSVDPARLAEIEAGGIGQRTAEGYGQVRFNHSLVAERLVEQDRPATASGEKSTNGENAFASVASDNHRPEDENSLIPPSDPVFAFARMLERECWKQELRRACLEVAGCAEKRKELLGWVVRGERGTPPMSQLGALREQLAFLRRQEDRRQVINWLEHLADNKRRQEKWPSIPKVKRLIDSDTPIWEIINKSAWPTLTQSGRDELPSELWTLAVRTFFDACIRAHKRDLEDEPKKKETIRGT